MERKYKKLFDENLIEEKQFELLDAIETNKIISVFNELRLMLYLGIILLSTGIGYFAYQNMGKFGHITCMTLLLAGIIVCFYYIMKYASPYSNAEVSVTHLYYDYILILVSLLIIGLFSYIQIYFNLVHLLLNWSTLISAIILLFMAYRYDNRGLLSMGITAFSATFGIIISPVNWTKGEWLPTINLYNTGIILGIAFVLIGQISELKKIKSHFRFTYQNTGLLIFFIAGIAAIFESNYSILYAFLLLISSCIVIYYSWNYKEFLFFLYSTISGYIVLTYLLIRLIESSHTDAFILLAYYFPISCAGYILFLIKKKNHFTNE
jgi:hypothetical protein